MKNIVLLGGAFNPPTIGHIKKTQLVMDSPYDLDELWFLPCYQSIWGKHMAPARMRLEMVRRAVQHASDFRLKVCDFEIRSQLTGHTFDILQKFFRRYPSTAYKFYFMIGMDHANVIHTWGNGQGLIDTLTFIVVKREGIESDWKVTWYLKSPHIYIHEGNIQEVSSTMARLEIAETGKTDLVAPSVLDLIIKHELYSA